MTRVELMARGLAAEDATPRPLELNRPVGPVLTVLNIFAITNTDTTAYYAIAAESGDPARPRAAQGRYSAGELLAQRVSQLAG